MSEKRKPDLTMMLRFHGNNEKTKLEVFKAEKWGYKVGITDSYRIRKDGIWWPEGELKFFKVSQIKELVFQGVHRKLSM